jgi:N-glycosylase/DNA lyase
VADQELSAEDVLQNYVMSKQLSADKFLEELTLQEQRELRESCTEYLNDVSRTIHSDPKKIKKTTLFVAFIAAVYGVRNITLKINYRC